MLATTPGELAVLAPDVDEQFAALVAPLEDDLLEAELAALTGGRRPDDPTEPAPPARTPSPRPVSGGRAKGRGAARARHPDAEPQGRERSPPRPDTDRA